MKCEKCGGATKVYCVIQVGEVIVRYRKCKECGCSFKTTETK